MPKSLIRPVLFSVGLATILSVAGCSPADSKTGHKPPLQSVPVIAQQVESKDSPLLISAIGRVEPMATVSIKPQVTGQISEVHFVEGQEVKAGDLLLNIDARPFDVALKQAQATLDQAHAALRNAETQAARYTELNTRGAVAKEQFDRITLARETARASVKSAEAAVSNANLELQYCTVRSPISGRTGKRLVDQGNIITANATDLVVINQIAPIQVSFTVAERYLGEITRYMAAPGGISATATPEGTGTADVDVGAGSGLEGEVPKGPVTFLDNAVKPGSGTVELKATFANESRLLWPGQFTNVELTLAIQKDAILAPGNAVLTGQKGQYVFVVKKDQTVEVRPVKRSRTLGDNAVISEGLKAGEWVVVDGQSRLLEGGKVEVKTSLTGSISSTSPSGEPSSAPKP